MYRQYELLRNTTSCVRQKYQYFSPEVRPGALVSPPVNASLALQLDQDCRVFQISIVRLKQRLAQREHSSMPFVALRSYGVAVAPKLDVTRVVCCEGNTTRFGIGSRSWRRMTVQEGWAGWRMRMAWRRRSVPNETSCLRKLNVELGDTT